MIFSELYSAYYNAVCKVLCAIIDGERDEGALVKIVNENAFSESFLTVIPALLKGRWPLVREDITTPIKNKPTMPLSDLQKRWLKAITLDPRMKLFDLRLDGLEDVEPLFTQKDYKIYDRYADGDDFEDEGYIQRFKIILKAIREGSALSITTLNKAGREILTRCRPIRLEYSQKDDKFRLMTDGCHFMPTINLSRIKSVKPYDGAFSQKVCKYPTVTDTVTLLITDERNALERVMLHFAHFKKQAERIDKKTFSVKIEYERNDEPEIIIRVLSFGPMVKIVAPERAVNAIREKLISQKGCNLK